MPLFSLDLPSFGTHHIIKYNGLYMYTYEISFITSGSSFQMCTLEYRINGGGENNRGGGGWKWFNITVIGGLE